MVFLHLLPTSHPSISTLFCLFLENKLTKITKKKQPKINKTEKKHKKHAHMQRQAHIHIQKS